MNDFFVSKQFVEVNERFFVSKQFVGGKMMPFNTSSIDYLLE
jgi:hypothetical protein